MEKVIDNLETLEAELIQLSSLCNVLGCIEGGQSEPPIQDVALSYRVIRDLLDDKAAKIEEVVDECYKARAGELATKP